MPWVEGAGTMRGGGSMGDDEHALGGVAGAGAGAGAGVLAGLPASVAAVERESGIAATAVVTALVDGRQPVSSVLDAEFFAAFEELAARKRMLDATILEMTAELLGRDEITPVAFSGSLVRRGGYRSVHEAVRQTFGLRRAEAAKLREVAEATRERISMTGEALRPTRSQVAVAVAEGRVTLSQASAIVAGQREAGGSVDIGDLDRAEYELVQAACGLTQEDDEPASPERLAKQAAVWVAFLDPDGAEPNAERQAAKRGLSFTRRADGMVQGRLLATPEQGETIMRVLDAYLSPRRDHACEAGDEPSGTLAPQEEPQIRDDRSFSQRRIDALVSVFAQHAESPRAPRTGGEAPTLVMTVTRAGLAGAAETLADISRLEHSGEAVPVEAALRILCDGIIRVALVDDDGEVLKLGRKRRLFSPAQRRAVFARDGGCRAPACELPFDTVEIHHVTPWSRGGRTDTSNGIALCTFHHHEVHLGRLTISPAQSRTWKVEPATGPRVARMRIRETPRAVQFQATPSSAEEVLGKMSA
ncbi:hypothetical protein C5B99_15600 [Pseudoclavibacter sp. Z016]|nr:hypothetical protein C5B99_15600 [Pseudoclavibacter sp. Z016]